MNKITLYDKINTAHRRIKNLDGRKIAFVLEGRDSAGKGSFVKFLMKYDIPFVLRVAGMPTEYSMKHWLSSWEAKLPKENEIVVFDRSWHTRSWVHPTFAYCTQRQYKNHIVNVQDWEDSQDVEIHKNWLSITEDEQQKNLLKRKLFKQWKYSLNDEIALKKFEIISHYKDLMFAKSPTWNIVRKSESKEKLLDIFLDALKPL